MIQDAGPRDIDGYGKSRDLVLVAAGKGEMSRMFERDAEKSPYDRPMRASALTYVKDMVPRKPFAAVSFNLVPGRVLRVPIATNDPITGQGANTASRAASIYLQRISEHGGNGVSC